VLFRSPYALNNAFKGYDIKKVGLKKCLDDSGYTNMVVIGSPMTHYSVKKALRLLGLGDDAFVEFEADTNNPENSRQMLIDKINRLKAENYFVLAVIGIAGTTESGEIDDLDTFASVAQSMGIHFHMDAAFGGAFILSEQHAPKLIGIEKADTVSLCGHKNLYMPIGTSMLLCANPQLLQASEINASYQARKMSVDLGKFTIEGTRKFASFIIGNILEKWGKGAFEEVLNTNVKTAQLFAKLLQSESFELYKNPVLNIVLYRFIPENYKLSAAAGTLSEFDNDQINQVNEQLQQHQFEHGVSFVSHTKLKKSAEKPAKVWLRAVFMNPFTTQQDLQEIIQEQIKIGQSLTQ
jgi:glutamate decarboxylase